MTNNWDQNNSCKLSLKVYLSLKKERTLLLTFDTIAVNCILKYLNYPRCLDLAWQASCHWHALALFATKNDLQFNYWIFQCDSLSCVINFSLNLSDSSTPHNIISTSRTMLVHERWVTLKKFLLLLHDILRWQT